VVGFVDGEVENVDTYIFQAEVYCEDCIAKVKSRLRAPLNPFDESTYDSDEYPKGPYADEESDTPEHCASCHVFLENPLTTDGYEYVREKIQEGLTAVTRQWASFYDIETVV
jgi:hypothetical protein